MILTDPEWQAVLLSLKVSSFVIILSVALKEATFDILETII